MINKQVLVYGGSGAQGSAIAQALIKNGHSVKAQTRSEINADKIKSIGAVPVYADFENLSSLEEACRECSAIVLTMPLAFDINLAMIWVDNVIKAAQSSSINCFVFNASGPIPKSLTGISALDIKLLVANKLKDSGLPVITIQPTLYMGNMTAPWSAPAIVQKSTLAYPLPEQQKVSWISWESMGEYIAAAVEHPELAGQSFSIGGSEAISGIDMADVFSNHMSKPVTYFAVSLSDFEAGLNQALGEPVGTEISKLYGWFAGEGASRLNIDNAEIIKALEIKPNNFKQWVKSIDWHSFVDITAA